MTGFSHKKLTFLVVDDFNSFRSTVTSMLTSLGASQVAMAGNGAEALDVCRRKKFDVILCDYDLGPGKNGQRVLESLRHHQLIDRESLFVFDFGRCIKASCYGGLRLHARRLSCQAY
ncbi:MAG: response regulator [Marinagarivorans sp.]|nr:response regulator [Marinagarivorans sp.]